uniref:uncharacterized protein LOC124045308 isoform X2 n=1 Tax=Oncorhynchus gorbuscha TaxID=8017 RepID=UPI001EAEEAC1|nr:uncharacterized protein LOC124045308 isoform X2 [Oncorhynchus gorbuscha]XP_046220565.1 uncharacterized protein LOC124045308 isoform X2 [Oncorhynchus gorbuscha]
MVTSLNLFATRLDQASSFPCVLVYVMDKSRSVNPVNFMSNMLYTCRILYKTKLPFIVVMNKDTHRPHKTRLTPTDAKSRKLQEQIEHLQKDMGAVAMEMTPQTEEADVLATVTSSTVGTRMRGRTATWMTSITAVSGEFYKIKSPCIPNKSIINKSYVGIIYNNNICHLADAFIQSDLQSCVHTFYVWVVPGFEPITLALQAPCSTN